MKLITEVNVEKSALNLSHKNRFLLLGSCFSQNIGEKLACGGFETLINPFGTMFNPHSIAESLLYISGLRDFCEEDVIQNGDIFKLISCHGDVFGYSKKEVLDNAALRRDNARKFLDNNTIIVITLGTAWLYTYTPLGKVMANCHKIDSKLISRRMMSVSEIVKALSDAVKQLKTICKCEIIFTVSPVRHKEGYRDNLLSKSALHLAVNEAVKSLSADYFPAYEIVFDQLRDYRFYSEDLLHPNNLAIAVIWEKFAATYFDRSTQDLCRKCEKLYAMLNHRPLYADSLEYKQHQERANQLRQEIDAALGR
ncbi:MAG: GSCFA domain-containing protein [Bacteroidales bacterium]|nr:GSCFA domain-containing protein [Bacteroidales bacterium]